MSSVKIEILFSSLEEAQEFMARLDGTNVQTSGPERKPAPPGLSGSPMSGGFSESKARVAEPGEDFDGDQETEDSEEHPEVTVTHQESEARAAAKEATANIPQVTKAARDLMEAYPGMDFSGLKGSGKKGNVLKKDVKEYVAELREGSTAEGSAPAAQTAPAPAPDQPTKEDAAAALREVYGKVMEDADQNAARIRCTALLEFFGAEKVGQIKEQERPLFLRYCKAALESDVPVGELMDSARTASVEPETADEVAAQAAQEQESPQEDAQDQGEAPAPQNGSEEPTLENARRALKDLNDTCGLKIALDTLHEFGAQRIDQLGEDQYAPFINAALTQIDTHSGKA